MGQSGEQRSSFLRNNSWCLLPKTKALEGKGVMGRGDVCGKFRKNSAKLKKDSYVGRRSGQERSVGRAQLRPGGPSWLNPDRQQGPGGNSFGWSGVSSLY